MHVNPMQPPRERRTHLRSIRSYAARTRNVLRRWTNDSACSRLFLPEGVRYGRNTIYRTAVTRPALRQVIAGREGE